MESYSIDISYRDACGKGASNRFRREGFIPANVYHRGEESISALLPYNAFVQVAKKSLPSQIFILKSESDKLNGRSALVKDIQVHHVSGRVLHVDFQTLHDDEEITVEVPLKFVGDPIGVKTEGGVLSVSSHEVEVSCLPKYIPNFISVDVSGLHTGDTIHARELSLGEGVALVGDEDAPIVSVRVPVAEAEATSVEGAAEGQVEGAPEAGASGSGATGQGAGVATSSAGEEKKKKKE